MAQSERFLGAQILVEQGRPLAQLRLTSVQAPGYLPVPPTLPEYVSNRDITIAFDRNQAHLPFTSKLRGELRQSTTREALVFLVALSKPLPGETEREAERFSSIGQAGAEALREYLVNLRNRAIGETKQRYDEELRRLQATGLLD